MASKALNVRLSINPGIACNDTMFFSPIMTLLLQYDLRDIDGIIDQSKSQILLLPSLLPKLKLPKQRKTTMVTPASVLVAATMRLGC